MKKKFLYMLAALFFALAVLSVSGCQDNNRGTPDGSGDGHDAEVNENDPDYGPEQGIDRETVLDVIAKDGASGYAIVIPVGADECITYAGTELQRYIRLATDAELPVRYDSQVAGTIATLKIISLGRTRFLNEAALDTDYSSLNYDGFIIKTKNKALFIDGPQNSAVLNGVYDFCETILDVKFLTAEDIVTPRMDEVLLYEFDRTDAPVFSGREYFANQAMTDKTFAARLRQNCTYGSPSAYVGDSPSSFYIGDGHTMETLLPYSIYGEAHPDWYVSNHSEYDYTNGINDEGDYDGNPDSMVGGLLAVCKEIIRSNKTNARYLMLGQPDNGNWGSSPKILASDAKYGGRSGTLMVFVNAVAKELADWKSSDGIDKEINIATFAYWKTIEPPLKLKAYNDDVHPKVKARDDVIVKIAHMTCSYHNLLDASCSSNSTAKKRFDGWSAVTKRLTVWDYSTNFEQHFFWFPNLGALKANYLYYKSIGVERVMSQGAPHVSNYYQGHLENYLTAKLLWNPYRDVNALIADFNKYYFGEQAGGTVTRFIDYMNYRYAALDTEGIGFHTELYGSGSFFDFQNYPKGFLEGARNMIQAEIDAVSVDGLLSPAEKIRREDRLLTVMVHPLYMLLKNYEAYYGFYGQKDFASAFFAVTDRLGIRYYGEGKSINDLKTQYGVS
jgi:hypothetical protein